MHGLYICVCPAAQDDDCAMPGVEHVDQGMDQAHGELEQAGMDPENAAAVSLLCVSRGVSPMPVIPTSCPVVVHSAPESAAMHYCFEEQSF